MKKGIVLPEGFHVLSQEEMGMVAGGTMRCPVKGDRGNYDLLREFLNKILSKRK